jgi:hypothetical protein
MQVCAGNCAVLHEILGYEARGLSISKGSQRRTVSIFPDGFPLGIHLKAEKGLTEERHWIHDPTLQLQ